MWEKEEERLQSVWALQLSVFVVLLWRKEEMSFLWPFPSTHTQTYTLHMCLSSNLSTDEGPVFMCIQHCCLRPVLQYTWVIDGKSAGEWMSEMTVCFFSFMLHLLFFFFPFSEHWQTHSYLPLNILDIRFKMVNGLYLSGPFLVFKPLKVLIHYTLHSSIQTPESRDCHVRWLLLIRK